MPADNDLDPVDRWLGQQVWPLSPPDGAFERVTRRARRRRVRKAVVSVASAAAVVAAIGVAVPLGLSSGAGSPRPPVADGGTRTQPGPSAHSTVNRGINHKTPASASASPAKPSATVSTPASGTASATTPNINTPGYVPANFEPFSVTFESLANGWVIGPAGTPGKCGAQQDSSICTSIARTQDGGQTWYGLHAPKAAGPDDATGVSGLRFLNTSDGWAFGPDLWATTDGGQTWTREDTGQYSVTDLEATGGQAYALFGTCSPPAGTQGDTISNCTSYTLETSPAGESDWTPVSGVPTVLASSASKYTSGLIETGGSTAYLAAPNGQLYAGTGTDWHKVGSLPCATGVADNDGLPEDLMFATAGLTSAGATRVAAVCTGPTIADTTVYRSDDGGASWLKETSVGSNGTSLVGEPTSLAALSDGTLILATGPTSTSSGGIYRLTPGATTWTAATLADPSGKTYGFIYVGMTSTTQGVAIGGSPTLDAIWMTTDGGQTWHLVPIKS